MADPSQQAAADPPAALMPLRVTAIWSDALRTWREALLPLTMLAVLLEIPLLVAELALHITPGLKTLADDSFTLTGAALVVFLYGSLSHHFMAGLLERFVAAQRRGHPRARLVHVLRDLPWRRLVVADLLLTGMVAIGLALFVIPGLVVLTWFSVTLPIVNLERNAVVPSFVRSYRLVRGHSWRAFGVALSSFVVPALVVGVVAAFAHRSTDGPLPYALAHAIPAIVVMPIAALPIVVMTFDLVDRDGVRVARYG